MTVAAFMDLALYDSESGYYARASRRSGRAGDFFSSVDVGPLFGELLEIEIAEMAAILGTAAEPFDLVEAGAGNGRLAADMLRTARTRDPALYHRTRLHLVEASAEARAAQRAALGDVFDRLASSSSILPEAFDGVLVANELLDAMPVHQAVMRADGLREVFVDVGKDERHLVTREGPPSTPALGAYLERAGIRLEPGWMAEINLNAVEWIEDAARRLRRGFVILVDYGHDARDLYSAAHAAGTLSAFSRHTSGMGETPGRPAWLQRPGEQDITTHVDFTSIRNAGEAAGLTTLGFLDQTYFLLGLTIASSSGLKAVPPSSLTNRLALQTLLMPGGLGST